MRTNNGSGRSAERKPLFSVTRDDCEFQTFTSGGKGGQHQNRTESGVRAIHRPSGAIGESRETRSQLINKRTAFRRMAETAAFKYCVKMEVARVSGELDDIEQRVDDAMAESNLKIEVF